MNYAALRTLCETHPTWPTVDADTLLAWVNELAESKDLDALPSGDVFEVIIANKDEWVALTADDRQMVRDILVIYGASGIPTAPGTAARTQLVAILGAGTNAALGAKISQTVSRVENAGLGKTAIIGDVQNAIALP